MVAVFAFGLDPDQHHDGVYTHVVQDTQREAISRMERLLKRRREAGPAPA